ncbi:MAG: GAF domain-containing protein [Thermomicrobiales bacterium]
MAQDPSRSPVPSMAGGTDVYTMAEAARLKGVSYHTVSRAVRRGKLPAQRLGKMAFISAQDLQAWRPMIERAPRKYRRRTPQPGATPALIDLASGERVELARQVSNLLQIVDCVTTEQPLAECLSILSDRYADALDLRRVEIWSLDDAYVRASRAASFGPALSDLPDEISLGDIPGGASYFVNKSEVEIEGVDAPESHAFGPLKGARAILVAPLRVGSRRLGLMLGDRGGKALAFSQDQLRLAEGIASLAALAIERERPKSVGKTRGR